MKFLLPLGLMTYFGRIIGLDADEYTGSRYYWILNGGRIGQIPAAMVEAAEKEKE